MTGPLPDHFRDFDLEEVLKESKKRVGDINSKNFILDFNKRYAHCALDVSLDTLQQALTDRDARLAGNGKPGIQETRWINIERPETQLDLIRLLGQKYGFSNRLLFSMLSDPLTPQPQPQSQLPSSPAPPSRAHDLIHPRSAHRDRRAARNSIFQEKQAALDRDDPEDPVSDAKASASGRARDLNHYRLVNTIWHYMSVDWGYDYTCISYNSIHDLKVPSAREAMNKDVPDAKRTWNWLVLCRDGTVISIRENPCAEKWVSPKELCSVRANLVNVFQQLSTAPSHEPKSKLLAVQVRATDRPVATSSSEPNVTDDESPSLLLYYLFDDWSMTYGIVSRNEEHFGKQLDRVRDEMFQSPQLDHIHKLHYYGRQLSILKRIYKSYGLIIERILKGPQSTLGQRDDAPNSDEGGGDLVVQSTGATKVTYGVPIPAAAAVRFERLKDRIHLYALSEIQSCLDEKESLMSLNFNLITIKESSYIERLTRITILLAKISILFIPVTFMSQYFTVPFAVGDDDVRYTPSVYWIAFAVIFALSFVGIILFGRLSGTQESKPIYISLTQATLDGWWNFWWRIRAPRRALEKSGSWAPDGLKHSG